MERKSQPPAYSLSFIFAGSLVSHSMRRGYRCGAYKGVTLPEMDLEGRLERRPQLVLVDELAHTNVAGWANPKRWRDVEALLAVGITVISTMNIQHLESVNDLEARLGHLNPTVTLNVDRHLLEREHTDYGMGAAEAAGVELGNDEGGAPAA